MEIIEHICTPVALDQAKGPQYPLYRRLRGSRSYLDLVVKIKMYIPLSKFFTETIFCIQINRNRII
jgi:hypothetical protein